VGNAAVIPGNGLASWVNADDANAKSQIDIVLLIPIESVQHDVVAGLLARQY
jgi:hypothetical protein